MNCQVICGPWDSSSTAPGDPQWIVDGPRMPELLSQGPQMTLELIAELGKEWYGTLWVVDSLWVVDAFRVHELLFLQGPNDSETNCGPWDSSLMAPGDSQWIVDDPKVPGLLRYCWSCCIFDIIQCWIIWRKILSGIISHWIIFVKQIILLLIICESRIIFLLIISSKLIILQLIILDNLIIFHLDNFYLSDNISYG